MEIAERHANFLGQLVRRPVGCSEIRGLGSLRVIPLLEQHAEVEGSVRVAALIGPPERLFRALQVPSVRKQPAEVEGRVGFAAVHRAAVGMFRALEVTSLLEQHA